MTMTTMRCPSWCADHQPDAFADEDGGFHRSASIAHTAFDGVVTVNQDAGGSTYIYVSDDRSDGEFLSSAAARSYARALNKAADKLDQINSGVTA